MKKILIIGLTAAIVAAVGCDRIGKSGKTDNVSDSTTVTKEGIKKETPSKEQPDIVGLWTLNNDKIGPDSTRNQINFDADGNGYYRIGSKTLDFKWIGKDDKIYLTTEGSSTHVYSILAHDAKSLVIQEDGSDDNRINHFVR